MEDEPPIVYIARDGKVIGKFNELELLVKISDGGLLRPTDQYRMEGERDWQPLAKFPGVTFVS